MLDTCRAAALELLASYSRTIRERGETLGIGQRGGYREIVQRHAGRFEVRLGRRDVAAPLRDLRDLVLSSCAFSVAQGALRDDEGHPDAALLSSSCVIANEDCEARS